MRRRERVLREPFDMTELRAREAIEMEGERSRSPALRLLDATDAGRDPPSLTPPPMTMTFPLSYGVVWWAAVGVPLPDPGVG